MIYNEYTISIETFSMVYKTNDLSLLSIGKILPGRLLRRRFKKIIDFFNKMLIVKEENITQLILKQKMSNLINNLLPNLFNGLMTNPTDDMIDWYKLYFGRIPETKEDLEGIVKEREKQLKIYNQMFPNIPVKENDTPFDFDAFVNGLEITNGIPINRKDRLFTLGSHYNSAVQMNEQRKRLTSNG